MVNSINGRKTKKKVFTALLSPFSASFLPARQLLKTYIAGHFFPYGKAGEGRRENGCIYIEEGG